MEKIIDFLIEPYEGYSNLQIVLELIAALLGIASVIFSARKNILVYPTGIISTAIYVYLLFGWGLYGDTLINAYYFTMSIYGWYMWSKVDENSMTIPVTTMTHKEKFYASFIFLGAIVLVLFIYHFKPYIQSGFNTEVLSQLPEPFYWLREDNISFDIKIQYVDTFTTALFFVGMWLMARKKLENWIFWIVGDLVAIPMYLFRGYGITAFQYFIFLIPAVIGYFAWRKDVVRRKQNGR
ncbi:nicotinamide riboside transporter PnuC [Balneicella halophila]|uniref:nicotinamide riboside transporter PnuC n=1 Tax=Balneicella halophila TaxID=1537566 RepID=UPI000E308E18|nr:nicotinamide riboside transporter PnuC [Balneicella halophila]